MIVTLHKNMLLSATGCSTERSLRECMQADGGQLAVYDTTYQPAPKPGGASHAVGSHSSQPASAAAEQFSGHSLPSGYEQGEPATLISPVGGRLVVFESHVDHEVLPAKSPRWAIAVWFHCPPQPLPLPPAAPPRSVPTAGAGAAPAAEQLPAPRAGPTGTVASDHTGPKVLSTGSSQAVAAEHIFVSIAAYRDPETRWTIKDLFAKASQPHRVYVGVVWQVDRSADAGMMRLTGSGAGSGARGEAHAGAATSGDVSQPGQEQQRQAHGASASTSPQAPWWLAHVREVTIDHREASGPCKARALCAGLWAGEEFVMQVDAHMRCVASRVRGHVMGMSVEGCGWRWNFSQIQLGRWW